MKTEDDWNKLEEAFAAGLELPTQERPAFWQSKFTDNPALRAELDLLIRGERAAAAAGFLDKPAWSFAALSDRRAAKEDASMVGAIIGGYEIIKSIGKGGMGEVYLARDKKLARDVALKVVRDTLNHDAVARFEDERRILGRIEHDNVARLYDGGVDDAGRPFIVMEYLRGFVSLREFLRPAQGTGLPPAQVKEISRQVCIGLAQAHDQRIVHRDMKPENIMLVHDRDGLRVKVIDFGIAVPPAFTTDEGGSGVLTHRPSIFSPGTTVYKSPEQLANKPRAEIKAASDVYSFGLVIYEMLAGRLAFPDEAHRLHGKMSPPASDLRPELGARVDAVLKRAFSDNPQDRQPDIRTLAKEIGDALPDAEREIVVPPQPAIGNEVIPDSSHYSAPTLLNPRLRPPRPASESDLISAPSRYSAPTALDPRLEPPLPPKPRRRWLIGLAAAAVLLAAAFGLSQWLGRATPVSPPVSTTTTKPPAVTPVAPAAAKRMTWSLRRNNEAIPVAPATVFHNGDLINFKLTFAQDGYLYVLNHGGNGALDVLLPDLNVNGGDNRVTAGKTFDFPPPGSTRFGGLRLDTQTGVETFYFVFAPAAENATPWLTPMQQAVRDKGRARRFAVLDPVKLKDWFDELRRRAADSTARKTDGAGMLVEAVRVQHQP